MCWKQPEVKYGFDTKINKEELVRRFEKNEVKIYDIWELNDKELVSGEDLNEFMEKFSEMVKEKSARRERKPVLETKVDKEKLMRQFDNKEIKIDYIRMLNFRRLLSDDDYKEFEYKHSEECSQWRKESTKRMERLELEYVKSKGWCLETKIDKDEWMNKLRSGEVKFSDIVELNRQRLLSRYDLEEFRRVAIDMLKEKLSVKYQKFKKEVKVKEATKEGKCGWKRYDTKYGFVTKIDKEDLIRSFKNNEIQLHKIWEMNEQELVSGEDIDEIMRISLEMAKTKIREIL